jgi:glycerol-3-phosphate dehydrogenase
MIQREEALASLAGTDWDLVIIGGGATGLGAALDASSRGYRTLLLEQQDFAKGTSSRSTKLIHGGVRYLRQGNISLVRESLHERALLLKNAPSLVRPLEFIVPTHSLAGRLYYGAGLKAYDLLAGAQGMPRSRMLSTAAVLQRVPTLDAGPLSGGVSYHDAQFDDARLALAMVRETIHQGGLALNYMQVEQLTRKGDQVRGVLARDGETGREFEISARVVINAAGIFCDTVRKMDDPACSPMLRVSQGTHLVVDRRFLPGETAIIVPDTDDGRVLFLIPWHQSVVIGTTDVPRPAPELEPAPLNSEIDFLLQHAARYLAEPPRLHDIRSCFSGLRPLVSHGNGKVTSQLSRDHVIEVSKSRLVTITGGKWTTYRRMAADAVNAAVSYGGLTPRPCVTASLALWGHEQDHPGMPQSAATVTDAFVRHAVQEELARTVEDVLSRRCRLLLLDAEAAVSMARRTAEVMAQELGRDSVWVESQIVSFGNLAKHYRIGHSELPGS